MAQQTHRIVGRLSLVVAFLALSVLVFGPMSQTLAQEADSPAMKLSQLKLKFDGARSCGGKNCHDKPGADVPPAEPGHELTIWADADLHRKAYETLSSDDSRKIGGKVNIADVTKSERCLNCHALNVPADLQGQKFVLREGNTCGSCHGPSQKWLEPHAEKGWTEKQRAAMSHDKLLAEWGLYDTKPLVARAEICVSCHVAIDADLVAAGHPQPEFELDYFTLAQPKHWTEPDGYYGTKIWLAGQMAALEASANQLARRAGIGNGDAMKQSFQQTAAHLAVLQPAAAAMGVELGSLKLESVAADAANVARLAHAAKAKVAAFDPAGGKPVVAAALKSIASNATLAAECGKSGMDQQAWAISSLYNAYASAEKVPDADKDAMNKLIESKLYPPEGQKTLPPDQFSAGLKEVAARIAALAL